MTPESASPPAAPRSVAALLAHAERYGWKGRCEWEPAGPTNTGPQFIVTLAGDALAGAGRFRLVWTDRGKGYRYQPYFVHGMEPGAAEWFGRRERREVETIIRNHPVHATGAEPVDNPREWWAEDVAPPRVDELTAAMLAPVRRTAAQTRLPQTVWPSRFVGREFVGADCLLVSACHLAPGQERPVYAYPGSEPMLTVLPPHQN
ncbi:hypothetical protein ACIQF6_35840 [Kitasatospora sp. NPDC092948]|uniref:hypothetical protein n=1 Tax=Kitasatospora sp. NPDC092948 TaxID=3364088 RepID=UPI00380FDC8B